MSLLRMTPSDRQGMLLSSRSPEDVGYRDWSDLSVSGKQWGLMTIDRQCYDMAEWSN